MNQATWEYSGLTLERFPQQSNDATLQAWDAADEYILRELESAPSAAGPVLIFNDAFGALACALQSRHPFCVSDSLLSQLATRHNLALNHYAPDAATLLDSLADLPAAPALVIIKLPRTLALLEYQLHALRAVVGPQTQVVAAAKTRDVHTSTLQLFEQIIGPTRTSLAWKKARLIHCEVAPPARPDYNPLVGWTLDKSDYLIQNLPNVFSRGGLDIGARFFMQHLPRDLAGSMVDLGCGNGVVGLTALERNPDASLLFCDESYMAVESSRINVEHNRPQDMARCEFRVNDTLTRVKRESLQAVLCNPPFHQQQAITDQIAWQMFHDARRCLVSGGELRIVGNRHLDYFHKLKRLFGNCEVLASNSKFVVLRSVRSITRQAV
ncbi:23S rRNA (guanine(1835)-N(2))-methyltransferase RlmG [Affinibrenneria salicis]|uniref:Ribosomal RNA large subunit methyltransferase G n=1 Tax=Affinibrenneria salicis TaxID=2590031 RepID=A0A5J5G6U9_9GAMM|nr:23S rRNA (guanine(1835)-N(2))-methyltransferase RlmG [Affinibrenneria salicis]KAA9002822.1 23S rRNA (guanine(1835)-N(2))-methyltransferase RlmG [Affinibrenneria salicis]KAA9002891.1 23S rRNA (guanine(1835)-N(2))-methyltransferase RlmG [Affinibrenneria salicis]